MKVLINTIYNKYIYIQWDKPRGKVVIWWVLIYPVAAHKPCGHMCAQKKKGGAICQMTPTTPVPSQLSTPTINSCSPPPTKHCQ